MKKNQILIIKTNSCAISKNQILEFLKKERITSEFEYFYAENSLLRKFNDGEISINLCPDSEFFHDSFKFNPEKIFEAIIFSSISNPVNDNLMEVLLISDALRRTGISQIKFVSLYMSYLRQDRRLKNYRNNEQNYLQNLEPISSKLIFNFFENSGISEILLLDPHFKQVEAFSEKITIKLLSFEFLLEFLLESILKIYLESRKNDESNDPFIKNHQEKIKSFFKMICKIQIAKKFQNLFFSKEIKNEILFEASKDLENFRKFFSKFSEFIYSEFRLIAPDAGALKNTRNCADLLEEIIIFSLQILDLDQINKKIQICFIEKIRTAPGVSSSMSLTGDIKNHHCLIIDDILDSGSTLIGSMKILKNLGSPKSISAFITHSILSKDCKEKIQSSEEITFLFSTNSIKHDELPEKFVIFDLKNLLFFLIK